ncbi:MAG: hypothetical protein JWN12_383 [Candidatus Saccharibacteria bacterium]|nr:hypothetical protein [Candidatus Saccharibacteria bacterium]
MLNLELVAYVYESEVCMRGNILRGAHSRMNDQFNALSHRNDAWPKLLVFVIILFYVTIFALFALSYAYIFSGLWGSGSGRLPAQMVGDGASLNMLNDATPLSQNTPTSLDTNVLESINNDTASTPATQTSVRVNGNSVPVPSNGSVHKEISTGSGTASIDVNVQSNGSSNTASSSLIDLSVSSSSSTLSEVQQ